MSLLLALGFLLLIPLSQGQWAGIPGGGGNNQQGGDILSDQTAPAQLPSIRAQQQSQGFPQNFPGFPQQNNLGTQGLGGGANPFPRQPLLRRPPFLPPFGRPGQMPFLPFRGPFLPFSPFGGRPGFPPIGGRPGFPGFPGAPLGQQNPFPQQPPVLGGAGGQGQGLLGQGGNGAGGNQGNNGQQNTFPQQPPFLGGAGGQDQGLLGQGGNGAGGNLGNNGQGQGLLGLGGNGAGGNQGNNGQSGQGTGGGGLQLPTNGQQPWNFPNFNQGQGGQGTGGGLQLPTNGQGGQGGTPGGLNLPNVPGGFNFLNGGAPGGLNPQFGPGAPGGFNFLNGQNGQGQGGQGQGAGGLQLPNNGQGLQLGNLAGSPFTEVVGGSTNWDSLGQTQTPSAGGLPPWMQGGQTQTPSAEGLPPWMQGGQTQTPSAGGLPPWMQGGQTQTPSAGGLPPWMQGGQTQTPSAGGLPPWMQGGIQNPGGNGQLNPQGAQNNGLQGLGNGQNGGLPFNPFGQTSALGGQGANNQNPWTPSTPSQQQNTGVSDLLPGFTFPDNSGLTSTPGNGGTTTQGGNFDLSSLLTQGSGTETPSFDFSSLFGNSGGGLDTTQTSQDANIQNMILAMQNAVPPQGTNANNGNQAINPFPGLTAGNRPPQGSQSTNPFGNNPFGGNHGSPFGGAPGANQFQGFQGNPRTPTSSIPGLGGFPGGNMTGLPNLFESARELPPFLSGIPGFPQFPSNGGVSQTGQSATSTGTGNNQETPGVFNPPASQLDFLQGLGTANNPFPGSSSGGSAPGNSPFSSLTDPTNSPFSGSSSGTDPFSAFRSFDHTNVPIPGTSPFSV